MSTLSIKNLSAQIGDKKILNNVSLEVKNDEIHIIMGHNGSGKSTLAATIMGRPDITVTNGSIILDNKELLNLPPEKRARAGLFLAFQNPVALPGVTVSQCMRISQRTISESNGNMFESENFRAELTDALALFGIDNSLLQRGLNDGLSGGEKKRMELLQLMLRKPYFAILDEIDSGLDIDGLKLIASALKKLINQSHLGAILITHYPSLLDTIKPDKVHIMNEGAIVATGGIELIKKISENGYGQFAN